MAKKAQQPNHFVPHYAGLAIAIEAVKQHAGEIAEFVYAVDNEQVYRFRTADVSVESGLLVSFVERNGFIYTHEAS